VFSQPPAAPPESLAAINTAAGHVRCDGALTTSPSVTAIVLSFVGEKFAGPASGTSPSMAQRRDRVERGHEHQGVVPVSTAQADPEQRAGPVDHNLVDLLRSRYCSRMGWSAASPQASSHRRRASRSIIVRSPRRSKGWAFAGSDQIVLTGA
jgi:hypothetical protein